MLGALAILGCLMGLTGSVGLLVQLRREEEEKWRLGEGAAAILFMTGLAAAIGFIVGAVIIALSPRMWHC